MNSFVMLEEGLDILKINTHTPKSSSRSRSRSRSRRRCEREEITVEKTEKDNKKMNKFLRLCQTVAVITAALCLLCLWVVGSLITIEIDNDRASEFRWMEGKIRNITSHVDMYCAKLERKRQLQSDVNKLFRFRRNDQNLIDEEEDSKEMSQMLKERALKDTILHQTLVYIKDLEQMWCLVPKAASTSWSKALIERLDENMSHPKILNNEEDAKKRNATPTPLQLVLKGAYKYKKPSYEDAIKSDLVKKILLVRHPFERLVSAYEDKLKNRTAKSDSLYFFRTYGFNMNRSIRKRGPNAPKQREPTFEEFIEYLLRTDPLHYDEHWQPITLLCDLCHIKYDHVIRQEDLEEMSTFHLNKLGFSPTYVMSVRNRNEMKAEDGTPNNFTDYFKNIPRQKMVKLFQKYQDDFNLFNYKFFDYYIAGL